MSESHIRIKNEYFRTPEFIEFYKQRKSLVYFFLEASIIRGSDNVKDFRHPAYRIYKEYFLNGKLVGRYSQKKMEKYLGTSQGAISRYLKELEHDGFIKKIVKPTQIGNALYYQFGIYDGEYGKKNYKEKIWLDEFFSKKYRDSKKTEVENRRKEAAIELMKTHDWVDYVMLMEKFPGFDIDEHRLWWDEAMGRIECTV